MFVVHSSRIERVHVPPAGFEELCDQLVVAFRWSEPFIAASFLFIAGYSLVLSHAHFDGTRRQWVTKVLRRALLLGVLSVALFVAQYGIALPDMVVSSGILSAIALAIALVGFGLVWTRSGPVLGAVALIGLAATAALDLSGATVSGLNAGPGGAIPLVSFAAFGALVASVVDARGLRGLGFLTLALLPVTAIAALSSAPWLTERTSHYASTSASSLFGAILRGESGGAAVAVAFWNHSAVGAVGLSAPLCAALWLALAAQNAVVERRVFAPLLLLGRHALAAYVAHLGLLGLIDAFDLAPSSPLGTLSLVLLIALICWALAAALERRVSVATAQGECDRAPA
jgi:uncharacterized membrane protein